MAKCKQCGRNMPGFTWKQTCAWCEQYNAAQRGEVSEVQPVMATPWRQSMSSDAPVTYALLVINVVVFIVMVASGVSLTEPTGQDMVRWGSNFGPYTLGGQYWRIFTHMFLHIGIFHLVMNMWFLYQLGSECERLLGSVTYTAMYFISGVAGGVASLAWHPMTNSAGASGALFGILGAMIAALKFGEFSMPTAIVRAYLRSMLWCAGINLVWGMTGGIDNAAHIGGMVAGCVIGFLVAKAAPDPRESGKRALILLIVAVAVGGGFWWERGSAKAGYGDRYSRLLQMKDPNQAVAEVQAMIQKDPNDSRARFLLASLYERKGDSASAFPQYEWILTHVAKNDRLRPFSGTMVTEHYISNRQYAEGEKYFSDMVGRDANDAVAHVALAYLAEAQSHSEVAIAEFQKVAALRAAQSDDDQQGYEATAYAGIGRNSVKMQRYDDAIAAYRKAIDLSSNDQEDEAVREGLRRELSAAEKAKQSASQSK